MAESGNDEGVVVAAAAVVDDGRVLLVRRRVEEGRLPWQFPAGKLNPGESGLDSSEGFDPRSSVSA
jgi:8-oxo-dGTP diphosphatase